MTFQQPQIALTANHQAAIRPRKRRRETRSQDASRPGANVYDRRRDLPGLLPVWPDELSDESTLGRHRLVMKLHQALRAERNRGQAGHWSYDLTRHTNLLHAYRHELHALPDPNWRGNYDWLQVRSGRQAGAPEALRPSTPAQKSSAKPPASMVARHWPRSTPTDRRTGAQYPD